MDERRRIPPDASTKRLHTVLGQREVWSLAFGAMIGWGWVVLSGEMIDRAGSLGSMVAIVVGAVMVGFVGLAYAELTPALPRAGGELGFSFRAFGPTVSWICGWALLLAYTAVSAFEAVALPTVLDYLVPDLRTGFVYRIAGSEVYLSWILVGVGGALFIGYANWRGMKTSAFLQWTATLGLLVVGLAFFAGTNVSGRMENLHPLFTDMGGLFRVVIMTPFLFIGFDVIPQAAEEIRLPAQRIGALILFSISMAAAWYILVQWGVGLSLSADQHGASELPTADAMAVVFRSPLAGRILVLGGILGIVTSWNAFFVGGTRLIFAMARGRMLPQWLARLHPRYHTPSRAIAFVAGVTLIAPFFGRQALVWVVDACGLATVIAYFLVVLSFLKLRTTAPELHRPFKVRHGRIVGALALLITAGFVVLYLPGSPSALIWPYEWMILIAWGLLGLLFYVRQRRRNVGLTAREQEQLILGDYATASPAPPVEVAASYDES